MVASKRGAAGGHQLSRPAEQITLGDIVRIMEGSVELSACLSSPELCDRTAVCLTRAAWQRATDAMLRELTPSIWPNWPRAHPIAASSRTIISTAKRSSRFDKRFCPLSGALRPRATARISCIWRNHEHPFRFSIFHRPVRVQASGALRSCDRDQRCARRGRRRLYHQSFSGRAGSCGQGNS